MEISKMPVIFVGHGSPLSAIEDDEFAQAWKALGAKLPKPRGILAISAHFYTNGTYVTVNSKNDLIYDFYGFPEALYQVKYPTLGDPVLAEEIAQLIPSAIKVKRGLDHGVWAPLKWIFPNADIPVVSLSIDGNLTPAQHFALGQKLARLREEGILIFCSGDVVHNLGRLDWDKPDGFDYANDFDNYIKNAILSKDYDAVVHYERAGNCAKLAFPTPEHFLPLLYALGSLKPSDTATLFNERRIYGSLSMTGYCFASAQDKVK